MDSISPALTLPPAFCIYGSLNACFLDIHCKSFLCCHACHACHAACMIRFQRRVNAGTLICTTAPFFLLEIPANHTQPYPALIKALSCTAQAGIIIELRDQEVRHLSNPWPRQDLEGKDQGKRIESGQTRTWKYHKEDSQPHQQAAKEVVMIPSRYKSHEARSQS